MAEKLTKKAALSEALHPARPLLDYIGNSLIELDSNFKLDDDLFEAGLDSMGIMNLLLFIEDKFSVSLPLSELTRENFSTVNSISRLIVRTQSNG